MRNKKKLGSLLFWFKTSVWAFPLVLFVIFLSLTILKINGSSIGTYHQFHYGAASEDPNLLYGEPKKVRADEWLNWTQNVISQSKNDFNKFNPFIGSGRDVGLQVEVPHKDWSTIFRPHNWAFFVLPLENAFAFKWWLPLFMLIISSYFFILRILPGRKLLGILLSLSFGLSPFLLWWYQVAVFAIAAYAFLILILVTKILNGEGVPFIKNRRMLAGFYAITLGFLLSCFELLLYPPFQIPVAIAVVFYSVGLLLQKLLTDHVNFRDVLKRVGLILASLVLAGIVGFLFIASNQTPIEHLTSSIYPGKRVVESGDLHLVYLISGFLMSFLQKNMILVNNLSESSNFILLLPFFLIPGFLLLIYEFKKNRKFNWVFFMIQLVGLLFLLRAFVPLGEPFYKLLLLDKVPNTRLVYGLGFVGFLQIIYLLKLIGETKLKKSLLYLMAFIAALASFLVLVAASFYVTRHIPDYTGVSMLTFAMLAFIFCLIIFTFLIKKFLLGSIILFSFTLFSSYDIVPLYKGLGFGVNNKLIEPIRDISQPRDSWIVLDKIHYENVPLLAGRQSLASAQIYPDNAFWAQAGDKYKKIYNRQAHALFVTEDIPEDLMLVQGNLFKVKFYCSDFILQNVDYAISTTEINLECTKYITSVSYPKEKFHIYQVVR